MKKHLPTFVLGAFLVAFAVVSGLDRRATNKRVDEAAAAVQGMTEVHAMLAGQANASARSAAAAANAAKAELESATATLEKVKNFADTADARFAEHALKLDEIAAWMDRLGDEHVEALEEMRRLHAVEALQIVELQGALGQLAAMPQFPAIPAAFRGAAVRIWYEGRVIGSGSKLGPRTVLTARHVVDRPGSYSVKVIFPDGKSVQLPLKIVGVSQAADAALVSPDVDMPGPFAELQDDIALDAAVVIVGAPMGEPLAATLGFVSGKAGVEWRDPGVWSCTANAYYGNSGGPVYDANTGKQVGILVGGVGAGPGAGMAPNVSIFVPVHFVRALQESVAKKAGGS